MKPKKFVAALVALSLVFALVPAKAFAYVDYSGDQALTQVSAVYQFLKEYGGASDLPDADDTAAAEFYANILGQTATPFYSFLYNYSYYAIFAGWRVYQASDFADNDDAQWRYQESMDAAVEYLQHEWEVWLERYPAAGGGGGGGSSPLPQGSGLYIEWTSEIGSSTTFADGTVITWYPSYVDEYNSRAGIGRATALWASPGDASAAGASSPVRINGYDTHDYVPPYGDVGYAVRSQRLAASFGVSDSVSTDSYTISPISSVTGSSWNVACNNWYGSSAPGQWFTHSISDSVYGPVGYYNTGQPFEYSIGSSGNIYLVTNAKVWTYGVWSDGQSVPAPEGPTGPTAPDYETPEPFQPVNPTLPNITNNITNNPSSYTGSETDYSEYLKIIIDNQKQQIQQFHDLGTLIDNEWDGFTNWLNTELDNVLGYLYNYQQFWNTLLEYQKSANGYLYSIDQQILKLRNQLSNDANMLWGLLRDIYYKIPSDGGGTLPDITIDDGNGGGFLNWLYDLIEQAVDLLVGGSAELTGMLDDLRQLTGVFPFSLPWDLIAVLTILQHEPVGDLTLQYPIIDGVAEGGGVSWTWHELDLTFAQPLIVACNFGFFGLALLGLIHATKDMFEMVNKVVG